MDITIHPGKLRGSITVIPSKSQAHRMLICAAFADAPTRLYCPETNLDIEATADCLRALGADICRDDSGYLVTPAKIIAETATLPCGESGSTLRFMLPVAGALGVDTTFELKGRLPQRPLSPLWEEMERMGCRLSRPTETTIRCQGKLVPGAYSIDGGVSSQFITGLMLALSLMEGESRLEITGNIESAPYIELTRSVLRIFGGKPLRSPSSLTVEGDWSNGAFFLAANALGSDLEILGLDPASPQGDREAAALIPRLLAGPAVISAADIPDLVPILSVVAAANHGCTFTHIERLRLKESDRVQSVMDMLRALGGQAEATQDTLTVQGGTLTGGCVDSHNDHRIAMATAIAATVCTAPVTLSGAQAVTKSYPRFWEEYSRLGGNYELNLR